jgi:hypothetical protein
MSPEGRTEVYGALAQLGYSSLTDLLIDRPALSFWTASTLLSDEGDPVAPVDIERTLRTECDLRDDFHFFARAVLFTSLHSRKGMGWGRQHYLLEGWFLSTLDESVREQARICCDHLRSLELPDGWKPESIFDPILEAALSSAFPFPNAGRQPQ